MSLIVPSSGAINFQTLATVFGLTGPPYDLARLKRDGTFVPVDIPSNASISTTNNNLNLLAFRGASVQYTITLNTSNNVNLYTLFTGSFTFTSARKYVKFTIPSGVTIGSSSSATAALDIGQFPTGTVIEIVNSGNIYGASGGAGVGGTVFNAAVGAAGGATNGGTGGDAIKANYLNQTVTITNNGVVYGGGGGGGGGGKGATGASYYTTGSFSYNRVFFNGGFTSTVNSTYWIVVDRTSSGLSYTRIELAYSGISRPVWSDTFGDYTAVPYSIAYNTNVSLATVQAVTEVTYNGVIYVRGAYQGFENFSFDSDRSGAYSNEDVYFYAVAVKTLVTGAVGGNGGSGSSGRGNNYSGSLTGITGANSSGNGSTGGNGGNGGDWGQSGSAGAGTNPGSGGSAGRYLLKGSATVTLTGGTTAGLLA